MRLAPSAASTEHGKAHRNAVILVGFKGGAVRTLAPPRTIMPSSVSSDIYAGLGQLCDHSGNAVGLLDLELLRVADNGFALSVMQRLPR